MAEFVFKDIVKELSLEARFIIASSGTSREELGNPVHRGTVRKLSQVGIKCEGKTSMQFSKQDYTYYDYILCMDTYNVKSLIKIIGDDAQGKIKRLLDFSSAPRDIADPWYTGDFDETYDDVKEGCDAFLSHLYQAKLI